MSSSSERDFEVALMSATITSPVMLFESRVSSLTDLLHRRLSAIIAPTVSVMSQLAKLTEDTCELFLRPLKSFSHLAV